MRPRAGTAVVLALLGALAACARRSDIAISSPLSEPKGPDIVFTHDPPSEFELLPGWRTELKSKVLAAFAVGCPLMTDRRFDRACHDIQAVPAGDETAARDFLRTHFRPSFLGSDMLTGYFELTLRGSRTPDHGYTVPVLAAPRDPQAFARPDIMGGALAGQNLEIVYLRSEADLYFLQLQGSGRVILPDGRLIRLGTAADNGRPRIPPEHLFGEAQIPEHDLSIPGIRAWARDHVPETNGRLARDQTYVFMRELPGLAVEYGPYGAMTLPLLPLRSVAVDPRTTPLGAMLWIDANNTFAPVRLPHLVIAQDTGGLIQGKARLDMFYGWGPQAEAVGGHQHSNAKVWALVPR